MTSLRRRVVMSAIVIAATALVGCAILIYLVVRTEMMAHADQSLADQGRTYAAMCEYEEKHHRFEFSGTNLLAAEGDRLRLRISTERGEAVASSAMPPPALPAGSDAWSWQADDGIRWRTVRTWALSSVEHPKEDHPVPLIVEVARSMQDLDRQLERITWLLIGVVVVVVTGLSAALAVVLRRSLTPLARFSADLSRLDDRTLHTRLSLAGVPSELAPVVVHLNQLLERLDEAFARERTFSTAIAHELRTPVAGLRMQFEVALSRTRQAESYRGTLDQGLTIIGGLQRMITALLLLGRLDRDQVPLHPVEHDLGEAVLAAVAPLRPRAQERRVSFVVPESQPFRIVADPDLLGRIIANLVENAVAHADPGGDITITWEASGAAWRLTIANPCARFRAEQLPYVFDRFWRGDESRTDVTQHAGLGLALCREIAKRLGLTLTASYVQARFVMELTSPTAPGSLGDR